MAYPNYYYPTNYQPYTPMMQQPQPMQQQAPVQQVQPIQQVQDDSGIKWVQGEAGAKAYPVAPNKSVLLMDSESSVMYIKATDNSGMPLPLRIFDYTERTPQTAHSAVAEPKTDTVTREEFERLKDDVLRLTKGIRKPQVNNTKSEKEG
jgi:hypothetical protein